MHLGKNLFQEHKLFKAGLSTGQVIGEYRFYTRESTIKIDLNKLREHFDTFVSNIFKRYELKLFKGKLEYLTQLQTLLDYYISIENSQASYLSEKISQITGVYVSKNTNNVQVQCSKCETYTNPQPFNCTICSNAFYCGQSCRLNHKYVHNEKQCRQNPFPKIITSLQLEVHLGGDLGQNIQIYYQHQSRLTFMIKGKAFIKKLYNQLTNHKIIKNQPYQIINNKEYLVLQKYEDNQKQQVKNFISVQKYEDLCDIYLNDPILYHLKILLLSQGCLLMDTVKEIYNTHLKVILVFACPV